MAAVEADAPGARRELLHALLQRQRHGAVLATFHIDAWHLAKTVGTEPIHHGPARFGLDAETAGRLERCGRRAVMQEQSHGGFQRHAAGIALLVPGQMRAYALVVKARIGGAALRDYIAIAHAAGQHHSGQVDQCADPLRGCLGDLRRRHAATAVTDHHGRAVQRRQHAQHMGGVAVEIGAAVVFGGGIVARQIDGKHLPASGLQQRRPGRKSPTALPGPVDQHHIA